MARSARYRDLAEFAAQYPDLGELLETSTHDFLVDVRAKIEGHAHITAAMIEAVRKFLPTKTAELPARFANVVVDAVINGEHIDGRERRTFTWASVETGWRGRLEVTDRASKEALADWLLDGAVRATITAQVVWLPEKPSGFMILKGGWVLRTTPAEECTEAEKSKQSEDAEPLQTCEPEPEGVRARIAESEGDQDWQSAILKRVK